MNVRIEIKSEGLQQYLRRIEKAANTTQTRALERAAIMVERAAKEKTPVNMGQLRQSITHQVIEVSSGRYEGLVGSILKYARWQEFGTRPHWVPVDGPDSPMGKWIIRKLASQEGIKGGKNKIEFMRRLLKAGLWVRGKGGKGKRHFVPFSIAPKLLQWAIDHGKAEMKAFHVSGKAQPFLVPALQESLPAIFSYFQKALGESLEGVQ